MYLRLLVFSLFTAAYALSATVSIGTFQYIPIVDGDTPLNVAYFKVTAKSGTVSDDVLDQIQLQNLRLVLEVQLPGPPVSTMLLAFTLYPDWATADAVSPAGEPGDSNWPAFPTVTLNPPNERFSRKFVNPIPGDGDVRITKGYLDYSGAAITPQSSWTLNNGFEFIPNLGVVFTELNNGGSLFPFTGNGFSVDLLVEGEQFARIPEPSTVALAVGGIALLMARRRFAR